MRIAALSISGFRAWTNEVKLDLDADAVIVTARNGQGKTSLFDAVMWSLAGSVPRLRDAPLISEYSETGQAFVSIELREPQTGRTLKISRLFDGTAQTVQASSGKEVLTGGAATQHIIETLWPTAQSAPNPVDALLAVFSRSVYLQQDLVRDFIQDEDKQARFTAISEISGTGRVSELQMHLDRAKTAWTKATNERYNESAVSRKRLEGASQQLAAMTPKSVDLAILEASWKAWWREAGAILKEDPGLSAASPRASNALDGGLKQLYSAEMALGRQMDEVRGTLAFLQEKPPVLAPSAKTLEDRMKAADVLIERLSASVGKLRSRQEATEAEQAERAKTQGEAVQLARLALRHLSERCPVCDQTYDVRATKKRLEKLLSRTGLAAATDEALQLKIATESAELSKAKERRALMTAEQIHYAHANQVLQRWQSERVRRLEAFPETSSDEEITQAIIARTQDLREQMLKIQRLRSVGEQMALQIASMTEAQRRSELLQEVKTLTDTVSRADSEFAQRNATGDLAGRILNALRESAGDLVKDQLREIEPTLQSIYETCDPHPTLKAVRLVSGMFRGRGQLETVVEDPERDGVRLENPAGILSSSQTNVLAVSLFLALNIAVRNLPLDCAILDDPLQSLDDLNLLGLVDVLRHVKDRRQLFISTHDLRFGTLLRRKLRPVRPVQRTRIIEIRDWSREGPIVDQYDALYEAMPSVDDRRRPSAS